MNTHRIKLLDNSTSAQIAAGEVIERPASIIKEIVENSLDSGANVIAINLQKGGIEKIEVIDNGHGIAKEDLPFAILQHATSKLSNIDDLNHIRSLGFRGEALASIHSCAKLKILSKIEEDESAWEQSGATIQPCARETGTTVIVENIFYNLPARYKFLRSARTEYLQCLEAIKRLALSNYQVTFVLKHNSNLIFKLNKSDSFTDLIKRIDKFYGKSVVQDMKYFESERNDMKVYGWASSPTTGTAQDACQYFFINNRVVKDRVINHAIRSFYLEYANVAKTPAYCIFLEIPTEEIDVNVHPTKHEVRFKHVRIVHELIIDALRHAFANYGKQTSDITHNFTPVVTNKNDSHNINFKSKDGLTTKSYSNNIKNDLEINSNSENSYTYLTNIQNNILGKSKNGIVFIDGGKVLRKNFLNQYIKNYKEKKLISLQNSNVILVNILNENIINQLISFGVEFTNISPGSYVLRACFSSLLKYEINFTDLVSDFIQQNIDSLDDFTKLLIKHVLFPELSIQESQIMLRNLENTDIKYYKVLQVADISKILAN